MGFEDLCNIKLSLSLGCVDKHENFPQFNFQKNSLSSSKCDKFFPFLTLSPSSEVTNQASRDHLRCHGETQISPPQASSISAISSFSNSIVKRERDVSYEVEVDRVSTKVVDHDQDEEVGARKKLRLRKEQSVVLEDRFKVHSNLNPKQKQELAKRLNLRPRQVEVWFQNRRARIKMKQTEVDCELLKKYCETLTDENRMLRKELQELKASKLSAPVYMQLPAATLSLCPSCEKLSSAAENPSRVSFTIGARSHIYNPFTKPSAA